MCYGKDQDGVATKSVVVPRSFISSQHFSNKKIFFHFDLKPNASMKVTPKMAATLPDSNEVDQAIPLNHPTKKSSARKSKIKVYSA